MPFYAVANGRSKGVYNSWSECENQVKGYSSASYKKFDTIAGAQDFVAAGSVGGGGSMPSTSRNNQSNYYSNQNTSNYDSYQPTYVNQPSKAPRGPSKSNDYDQYYDDSADLDTRVYKSEDIEKRQKGVDNIYKKSGVKNSRSGIAIQSGGSFEKDDNGYVQVYTDGACSFNGRSGAKAGLGVYWGDNHPLNRSEPVSGRATNNSGEIQAATTAINQALEKGVTKLALNTDSKFLIDSATKWMPGWKQNGWKLASGEPVKNEKDFKDLDRAMNKLQTKWNYVEAHKGVQGNEQADQLAKAGASKYE